MAVESMIGGVAAHDAYTGLSSATQNVLDSIIGSGNSTPKVENVGTGSYGLDAKSPSGETTTVVYGTKGAPVNGTVTSGDMKMKVELPADTTLAATGVDAKTPDEVKAYNDQIVDKYLGGSDAASKAGNADIKASMKTLTDIFKPTSTRVVALPSTSAEKGNVVIDAGTTGSGSLTTLVMPANGSNVELRNVDASLVVGNGNVTITNAKGATVSAGLGEQNIMGGSGNDTMITNGGKDSMSGGAGADKFAMTGKSGNLAVSDFKIGEDKLVFKIDGISNLADLTKAFTGVTETPAPNAGVTVHFGDLTVTLTGLKVSDLTLDMLGFTL